MSDRLYAMLLVVSIIFCLTGAFWFVQNQPLRLLDNQDLSQLEVSVPNMSVDRDITAPTPEVYEEIIIWQINGLEQETIEPGGVHQCGAPSDNVYDCEVVYDIIDPLSFGCIIFSYGSNSSWLCP